ncbi:MAG: hypothetical protein IH881_20140 [Myxococcales bacterium]|nr:hypothetical protein [Myxococcales bacterium]
MMISTLRDFTWRLGGATDRVEGNRRKWNGEAGYDAYHAFCRSRFARSEVPPGENPSVGYERLQVIAPEVAADFRRRLDANYECVFTREKSPHKQVYQIGDRDFDLELLEQALTPAVDERVVRYFKSEYFVYWYTVSRAIPTSKPALCNSFRWHCDNGPDFHLKLLLYLNDFEEHGWGTEVIDRAATQIIARKTGYAFAPVRTRVNDLAPFAKRAGVAFDPQCPEMKAGEGILFPPAQALHRGVVPDHGPRIVASLCMLPSPIPWREAFDRYGIAAHDYGKWHTRAADLQELLTGGGVAPRDH